MISSLSVPIKTMDAISNSKNKSMKKNNKSGLINVISHRLCNQSGKRTRSVTLLVFANIVLKISHVSTIMHKMVAVPKLSTKFVESYPSLQNYYDQASDSANPKFKATDPLKSM